ncbi:MAG: signal recognition particle-docking protein FtsY [Steroidobacteraceae bacterium]|nr:signal recognition particle-docking protein FtsY [Nevskiaceae bacterium]MCP5339193.1 signal recognition particle-docking protein FtsY [Nevskiaceae bacterium]MCP5359466.1 signal recognition particle-docking protein FtsY [Nevskiaceae bacterium]MCP5466808.1 signal recognition particle-docking protein FtsY [Nevskiaceae bacterium]MCP5470897.1 signal recognition particle-docking protein FtsY [Nevskiaceae bacterium]
MTPPDDSRQGFFQRLRAKLNPPNSWLSYDLGNLFRGRKIDAEILEELETRLLGADVGVTVTEELLEQLRRQVARNELADVEALMTALREAITATLLPVQQPLRIDPAQRPYVILVVGVNGSGKTTTIGKLARRFTTEGRSVLLAAGDTFRAAAIEQLGIWAQRSGVEIVAQQAGADPGAVVFDALSAARTRGTEVLLADTAGRLHSQSHLMEELKKVRRALSRIEPTAPHEVLLVLDANQGQNALAQAVQFHEAIGVTGLVLTKLDGTARGGIVLAIARRLGLPIRFIGIGEQAEDFGEFDAAAFARALVDGASPAGAGADTPDNRASRGSAATAPIAPAASAATRATDISPAADATPQATPARDTPSKGSLFGRWSRRP